MSTLRWGHEGSPAGWRLEGGGLSAARQPGPSRPPANARARGQGGPGARPEGCACGLTPLCAWRCQSQRLRGKGPERPLDAPRSG